MVFVLNEFIITSCCCIFLFSLEWKCHISVWKHHECVSNAYGSWIVQVWVHMALPVDSANVMFCPNLISTHLSELTVVTVLVIIVKTPWVVCFPAFVGTISNLYLNYLHWPLGFRLELCLNGAIANGFGQRKSFVLDVILWTWVKVIQGDCKVMMDLRLQWWWVEEGTSNTAV